MSKSQDPVRVAKIAYVDARRAAKRAFYAARDSDPAYSAAIAAEFATMQRAATDPTYIAANAAAMAARQVYENTLSAFVSTIVEDDDH